MCVSMAMYVHISYVCMYVHTHVQTSTIFLLFLGYDHDYASFSMCHKKSYDDKKPFVYFKY